MNEDPIITDEALLRLRHGTVKDHETLVALIDADPALGQGLAEWDRQDAAIATLYNPLAGEPVPARHADLIAAAVAEPGWSRHWPTQIAAAIVLVAFGVATGWFAALQRVPGAAEANLATAALRACATYTVEVAHPVEVLASQAHLEPWLSKRVGHPITPPDLSGDGFHLLGGRVVPDALGTAALMMYENDLGQRVTLYVVLWPSDTETSFRFANNDSAQGFWWVDDHLGWAVVGDLPSDTLRQISLAAYQQISPA